MPRKRYVVLFIFALLALVVTLATAQQPVDVDFQGTCIDPEDGDISSTLVWTSDVDGQIFVGASGTYPLSEGVHVITATCDDSGPTPAQSASVSITVDFDGPPAVVILSPADGSTINQ
jgi:hypothetical protein